MLATFMTPTSKNPQAGWAKLGDMSIISLFEYFAVNPEEN